MNIDKLFNVLQNNLSPKPFENSKTQEDFWDNDHISKMMLMAHLNPNWDAASRKSETIDKTCQYMFNRLDLTHHEAILDLGCGPGLYCKRYYEQGLKVTGIDYSKRSIAYAEEQATLTQQNIEYVYMNYLDMQYHNSFDVVSLIYCDFGVLSKPSRKQLLKKIHDSLKPGGHFVFDVWSTAFKDLTSEHKSWKVHEKQGFWKPTPHLELIQKTYDADNALSLEQHVIIENDTVVHVYNLWEQCYTLESLTSLLNDNGFEVVEFIGDLTGTPYTEASKSIGVIAKKG